MQEEVHKPEAGMEEKPPVHVPKPVSEYSSRGEGSSEAVGSGQE